jgi:hypothetical protein
MEYPVGIEVASGLKPAAITIEASASEAVAIGKIVANPSRMMINIKIFNNVIGCLSGITVTVCLFR